MNDQGGPDSKNGFVAQVIGNTSLLAAILIYTGWSYLNAQFAYFHLSVISLNISNLDYILHGTFLFIPNIIFVVVLLVIAIVFLSRAPSLTRFVPSVVRRAMSGMSQDSRKVGLGLLITVTAGFLAWLGQHTADWPANNNGFD